MRVAKEIRCGLEEKFREIKGREIWGDCSVVEV